MNKPQPPRHFETARTFLRPVSLDDAQTIFEGYSSCPVATRFMSFTRHQDLSETVRFATSRVQCWENQTAFHWVVISKDNGDLMGGVELRVNPPQTDFGYLFAERFWGRGFCTEAMQAIVDWASAQPEIFRVWATCHPDNAASARVLEKLGLVFEATLENGEARPQLGELAGPSLMFAKIR